MWGKIFKSSATHSVIFVKSQKWSLLMLFVVSFIVNRLLENLTFVTREESSRIFQQIGVGLLSLVEAFLVLLLFVYSQKSTEPTWASIWRYINESVRVLTRVLLWLVVAILVTMVVTYALGAMGMGQLSLAAFGILALPFLIYIQYALIGYVVFFDSDYHQGKVDALVRARNLVKGILPILILLSILFLAFESGFELGPNLYPAFQPWPIRFLFAAGSFLLNIYSTVFCFVLFETRRSQLT